MGSLDLSRAGRPHRSPQHTRHEFCQSFYTAPRPDAGYGPGHRNVCLDPRRGMLVLDVVDGRIMFVEVLDYPPL